MLGRDGIQVAVAIQLRVLLIAVEVFPGALHLFQFFLWGKVTGLPVASKLLIPDEGTLLALPQAVDHLGDIPFENRFLGRILTTGIGKGHGGHVVSGAVTFEFRGGRIPAVGLRITLRRESVGVTVVIELLFYR